MTVFEKVADILTELCGAETVSLEGTLQDDLALDSLHMVMLLVAIEDRFAITLDEADMNPFDLVTVRDVVKLVQKYRGDDGEKDR